ncbi:hypothetical protein RB195_002875 [Necator americanus]|uniref:Uncharacterized protein n=1 Tax=Necator americanus TaxID=51031 RepID=A0ABR1DLH6_NECAM
MMLVSIFEAKEYVRWLAHCFDEFTACHLDMSRFGIVVGARKLVYLRDGEDSTLNYTWLGYERTSSSSFRIGQEQNKRL